MATFGMGRAKDDFKAVDKRDIAMVYGDDSSRTAIGYWVTDECRSDSKTMRLNGEGLIIFVFVFDLL